VLSLKKALVRTDSNSALGLAMTKLQPGDAEASHATMMAGGRKGQRTAAIRSRPSEFDAARSLGGTYRIERVLGVGGMGVVALAFDEKLERRVAIKFVNPALFVLPEMHKLFVDEARGMATSPSNRSLDC
jgi:serine/threonine protein kinase